MIKTLKGKKIREIDWKKNSCAEWRDHIILHATLTLFTQFYHVFIIVNQESFMRKYMLLVIDYVNFATYPTILTRRPTIFIGILKYNPIIMYVK